MLDLAYFTISTRLYSAGAQFRTFFFAQFRTFFEMNTIAQTQTTPYACKHHLPVNNSSAKWLDVMELLFNYYYY